MNLTEAGDLLSQIYHDEIAAFLAALNTAWPAILYVTVVAAVVLLSSRSRK